MKTIDSLNFYFIKERYCNNLTTRKIGTKNKKTGTMNVSYLQPAQLLLKLWQNTKMHQATTGFFMMGGCKTPTLQDAEDQLKMNKYVDYFFHRPIKVNFRDMSNVDSYLYDRDAGQGKFAEVVNSMGSSSSS